MNSRSFLSKNNLLKIIGIAATGTIFLKIISNSISTSTLTADKLINPVFEPKSHDKLISVILVTRHGARTPLKLIPGIKEVNIINFKMIFILKRYYYKRLAILRTF